jgi:hypothetical protein
LLLAIHPTPQRVVDEYMSRTLAVTVVLAAAAGATYLTATKHAAAPPQLPPVAESSVIATTTTDAAQTGPSKVRADESPLDATLADEERAAAIKHAISNALAKARESYAKALQDSGLASADSQRIAQQLVDEVAGCIFEAALAESAASGVDRQEFLTGAEVIWSQPTEASVGVIGRGVRSSAVPCVANAYQLAGITMPDYFASAGNEVPEPITSSAPPPWAAEMEVRLREHISSYRALDLTGVLVKCREQGCQALIVGHDIPIFDLEFDVFAERNGFRSAIVGGDSSHRIVWLQRE